MTDDLPYAFDIAARVGALAGPDPLDRISLRDHVAEVEIGAFEQERGMTQRLRFDIVVEVKGPKDVGDDVDRILSYDRLAEAVADELRAERLALLETLAERVAARILREPQAQRVFLRVQKLDRGPGELGVEIVRSRKVDLPLRQVPDGPRPLVILLSPSADPSPFLARWEGEPLLLCPSTPAVGSPKAATTGAQRRIDLLGLDQAAWLLASRDSRLRVTATRTEMDWALRRGHSAVWAPSRLALDSPGAPLVAEPLVLASWMAREIGAWDLLRAEEAP